MHIAHAVHRFLLISGFLAMVSGCGHVAGNYPQTEAPKPEIPDEHKVKGEALPIVWEEPGKVRGFLIACRPLDQRTAALDKMADSSGLEKQRKLAEFFHARADENLGPVNLFVYFKEGVERRVKTGDFLVEFADGTQTRDVGILYLDDRDSADSVRYSVRGPLKLSNEPVGLRKPLYVLLFLEPEYKCKEIASVKLAPARS